MELCSIQIPSRKQSLTFLKIVSVWTESQHYFLFLLITCLCKRYFNCKHWILMFVSILKWQPTRQAFPKSSSLKYNRIKRRSCMHYAQQWEWAILSTDDADIYLNLLMWDTCPSPARITTARWGLRLPLCFCTAPWPLILLLMARPLWLANLSSSTQVHFTRGLTEGYWDRSLLLPLCRMPAVWQETVRWITEARVLCSPLRRLCDWKTDMP